MPTIACPECETRFRVKATESTEPPKPHRGVLLVGLGLLGLALPFFAPVAFGVSLYDQYQMDRGKMDKHDGGATMLGGLLGFLGSVWLIVACIWVISILRSH